VLDSDDFATVKALEEKHTDATVLDVGTYYLASTSTADGGWGNGSLYLFAKDKEVILNNTEELFSFGSGTWEEGSSAKELMDDKEAGWLSLVLTPDTMCVLQSTGLPLVAAVFSGPSQS
jgi:hypothetical protein